MSYCTRLALAALSVVGIAFSAAASASEAVTYTYDARGRLIKVVRDKPSTDVQACYKLDKAENRTRVKVDVNINVASPPACPT